MKQIRYPYVNNPFGFKLPEPKPIIHPIINKWDDFSEEDKIILSNIKKIISSDIGDCKVSIFGSRIKGYWTEMKKKDAVLQEISLFSILSIG
jgi:septin family protein